MIRVGIWLPVYGSWLRSIESSVKPDAAECVEIAKNAENIGLDFVYASENLLNCIHGQHEKVLDAWTLLTVIGSSTKDISLIGAVKPGFRSPLVIARMIDTLAKISGDRIGLNLVCGWWRSEFDGAQVDWLDHEKRYDRAETFLCDLRNLYFEDPIGDATKNTELFGKGIGLDREHFPEIWVSGHSNRAKNLAANYADSLFLNGMPDKDLSYHIGRCREADPTQEKATNIIVNAHIIAAQTDEIAYQRLESVFSNADKNKIEMFREIMNESGASTWGGLTERQMVDSNAGFEVGLVGSFSRIRRRILELVSLGVSGIACQFDQPLEEMGIFMREVVEPIRSQSLP